MDKEAESYKVGGIDPAALTLASLAAVIPVLFGEGQFTVLSSIVGLTILTVIYAFDVNPRRSTHQQLAFSMVTALVGTTTLGWIYEFIAGWRNPTSPVPVTPGLLVICWAGFVVAFFAIERLRALHHSGKGSA